MCGRGYNLAHLCPSLARHVWLCNRSMCARSSLRTLACDGHLAQAQADVDSSRTAASTATRELHAELVAAQQVADARQQQVRLWPAMACCALGCLLLLLSEGGAPLSSMLRSRPSPSWPFFC